MRRSNSILEEFKGAFQKQNNTHVQLILINIAIFLILGIISVFGDWFSSINVLSTFLHNQFAIPSAFNEFITRPWTLVTYMFMHGGIFHLLFNMLWFYYFARLIVEYLGTDKLLSIYILGGISGGLLYLVMYNFIPFYSNATIMVGASAAINAVIVAAAVLLPNYTFYLMFFGPVKIKYIALFFVAISFLSITGGNAGGNIAHLGGAGFGYLFIRQLNNGNDIGQWVISTLNFFKSFFVRQPKMTVNYSDKKTRAGKKSNTNNKPHSPNQSEIDAILDKISQSGYESLSTEEKEKLFNASKK